MMMDETKYHDPRAFIPERFLPKPDGLGEPLPEAVFGFGRRSVMYSLKGIPTVLIYLSKACVQAATSLNWNSGLLWLRFLPLSISALLAMNLGMILC